MPSANPGGLSRRVEFISTYTTCVKAIKRFLSAVLQRKVGQAAWSFKRIVHMHAELKADVKTSFFRQLFGLSR